MAQWYVALLRAISNVGMQPFRQGMEELGFTAVESYGMSGNFLFRADRAGPAAHERRITAKFGTIAVVRTRPELARIMAHDPFGSSLLFLARAPTTTRRQAFHRLDFEVPRPILQGKTVYFVYPARRRGQRTPFDFERALGVLGTARSARVVGQLLVRMAAAASRGERGT
jgi:uncharacterized protein (DUF1697 family)